MKTRRERKAIEAVQRKHSKKLDNTTRSMKATLQALELLPLPMRVRTAWTLLTKGRHRMLKEDLKAMGLTDA